LVVSVAACGSPLESPIDNIRACDQLYDELRQKGCTSAELGWLNCDVLPGCPSGQVEKADIDACADLMKGAVDCSAALAVDCSIAKVNCASAAPVFQNAVGYIAACSALTDSINAACPADPTRSSGLCETVLQCEDGGAFSMDSIAVATDSAAIAVGCDAAENALVNSTIEKKYCYIPGN
jgi:hypothetical protein